MASLSSLHAAPVKALAALAILLGSLAAVGAAPDDAPPDRGAAANGATRIPNASPGAALDGDFAATVQPFLAHYCVSCHSGAAPEADFDLTRLSTMEAALADHSHLTLVAEKLAASEMPPKEAKEFPSAEDRARVVAWIKTSLAREAAEHAGDPGVVLARRLSNAEYNYTIRDLTGVDIRPTREFPVDPANPAGFDNSGESLAMSPTLMEKYLQAAREVAEHLVLKPEGIAFAPYPMLVETDRDKYCVEQIMDFYARQDMDYADYFQAAWRFKHRAALGKPNAALADVAAECGVSAKYLATVSELLDDPNVEVGPTAKLQTLWYALPSPSSDNPQIARPGCEQMRDFIVALRKKLEPRFRNLGAKGMDAGGQPMIMWRNRQYASHRMTYDPAALQDAAALDEPKRDDNLAEPEPGPEEEFGPGRTEAVKNEPGDPDLLLPVGERARYEAAFARFCAVFPDAFVVSERGRSYFDKSKDRGRYLSAGFHNIMGYFRDDQPLYELLLDERGKQELDELWRELDFVAQATSRTFVQFYLNEAGEARRAIQKESESGVAPEDREITSAAMIQKIADVYRNKAKSSENPLALEAVNEHFQQVSDAIRWVERAKTEAEPKHLEALLSFAARAYRRPLAAKERDDIVAFYRSLRDDAGLSHEDAMRDSVVGVLMSPDFCYRIDLVEAGTGSKPLSDEAIASRLSYFLWSSMPDDELLSLAASRELHKPVVLAAQTRRMLKDRRVEGLAAEFGDNWLDFRRFEELNTVDRERFANFTDELREAMFQEPIRFMVDVFQHDRSILDFLYAKHTFVNPALAKHYGMPEPGVGANEWVRVDDADRYDRGGILPMAAFLTKNAPGLRTSPVKRGYWVVKRVLGEQIPPPPAVVPELPRDEAKLGERTLREVLEQHRANPACATCHARFDAMGVVFEGFGPVGERRDKDLAGHAVDSQAEFPGGKVGAGVTGLRDYLREYRQNDFVDNVTRKLLAYALNRSLIASDESTVAAIHQRMANSDYRFGVLVESIVTCPQFLTKHAPDGLALRGE